MTIMFSVTISTIIISDTVHHHVYDGSSHSWQRRPAKRKSFVRVKARLDKEACQVLGMRNINLRAEETQDRALPDTGASVTMAGTKLMRSLGQSEANLAKCDMRLYGADNNDIQLLAVIPVISTDTATGLQTRQIVYICRLCCSALRPARTWGTSVMTFPPPTTAPPVTPPPRLPGGSQTVTVSVSQSERRHLVFATASKDQFKSLYTGSSILIVRKFLLIAPKYDYQ